MPSALGIFVPDFPRQTHIFFWREIEAMRAMGLDVALLSSRRAPASECRHAFAERARNETHYTFPPSPARTARLLAKRPAGVVKALKYIASLSESPLKQKGRALGLLACAADLADYAAERGIRHVHAHSCADAAHVVAMAELLGGPSYSLTLHGDLQVYGVDHRQKARRAVCIGCAGRHLVPQLVEQAGYPAERVLPNWMGLDTQQFRVPAERPGERAGLLRMLTVARLNRTKGHAYALRAMRQAIDRGFELTYTLAGEGPERAEVEAEIERLDLTQRVTLLGTQSEEQVRALLGVHDAFVLPSFGLGEAGPVSLMEAMSTGLPSVTSIIGSTPDMVEHEVSGFLVRQQDESALSSAFVRLAGDLELRRRIGRAARERAVEQFDCRRTAQRLVEFIEKYGRFEFARRPSAGEPLSSSA
jgi:colanic acid/amylovoran biosynthesis glycosyltransferase